VLGLSCYRALHHLRIGNLADAEADARAALETGPRPPGLHAAVALAALLETLAERAEFEAAEAADQRYRLAEQCPATMQAGWLIAGRGRLRLAERRPAAALFITTRTVEGHLTHAYQKLAITSREQLPAALAPPDGEATATDPMHL
jgi:hypothetical protein